MTIPTYKIGNLVWEGRGTEGEKEEGGKRSR
jgi:hypothetical protein